MTLGPRTVRIGALAFGKRRLAQLVAEGVVVRDSASFAILDRVALEQPRGVLALADGSLLSPGAKWTFRLLWHDDKPRPCSSLPLLPGAEMFGDRIDPERVWFMSRGGNTLFGYELEEKSNALVSPTEWISLDGFDHRAITSLRDGSFLYTTESGFSRFYGKGEKKEIHGNSEEVFRLLPGSRSDTVWVLRRDRRVTLYGFVEGKLARLQTVNLEADPFDAAADGATLAVLELNQPADTAWNFVLEVFDVSGKRRFRAELPALETLGEDWVERMTENRNLAVSTDPRRVAVGGPTSLTVFDSDTGKQVFNE